MQSDLSQPIHLVEHAGRWVVLDGYHRLLRTIVGERQIISAMRLSADDLAAVPD